MAGVMHHEEIMFNKLNNFSVLQLWMASLLLFVGSTSFITAIDFAGVKWLNIEWPSGPDIFPNMAIGYPLILMQLISAGLLIYSGIRIYSNNKGLKGVFFGFVLILLTGAFCFFTYALLGYLYQFELMGRSM